MSDHLAVAVLLGTNVPELVGLVGIYKAGEDEYLVTNRAKSQWHKQNAETCAETSGAEEKVESLSESTTVDKIKANMVEQAVISERGIQAEMLDVWEPDEALPNFSEEMFERAREQTKLTKSQKWRNAWARNGVELEYESELPVTELDQEQLSYRLDLGRSEQGCEESGVAKKGKQFLNNGLLYRKGGVVMEGGEARGKLLLPELCRAIVLWVAHIIPLAGHLGRNKTAQRIRLSGFLWPNVTKEVADYSQSCAPCQ